jgi:MinD-like ATPase involved in chromosome partitioning or flagellar assembly
MASKILFTAGAKGGTGKSTAARLLITFLRQNDADPLLLDFDDESSTLSRFFPEAQRVTIKKKSSHDVLVEQAISGTHPLILADLKAGTGREVLGWWLDVPFEELQAMAVTFVCLGSITSSPDSVQSFLTWVSALQDRVSYVVFKNLKDGDYLPDYEQTAEAAQFRSLFCPHHVVVPRLDEEYQTELERLNLNIAEVLDSFDGISARRKDLGPILSRLLVRARLRSYQQRIYEQFDPIRSLLLPE